MDAYSLFLEFINQYNRTIEEIQSNSMISVDTSEVTEEVTYEDFKDNESERLQRIGISASKSRNAESTMSSNLSWKTSSQRYQTISSSGDQQNSIERTESSAQFIGSETNSTKHSFIPKYK